MKAYSEEEGRRKETNMEKRGVGKGVKKPKDKQDSMCEDAIHNETCYFAC